MTLPAARESKSSDVTLGGISLPELLRNAYFAIFAHFRADLEQLQNFYSTAHSNRGMFWLCSSGSRLAHRWGSPSPPLAQGALPCAPT